MAVIDTNDNTSARIDYLRARGVTAVGRYYSSSAWKRLTKPEAKALSEAGIRLFTVFENSGDPELSLEQGVHDAQIALQQATQVTQPEGSAIFFAMEHLPNGYNDSHVPGIKKYFGGLRQVLGGKYKLGVYSDGIVCDALLSSGACEYAWLSASTSFPGSKDFDHSGKWALAQRRVDLDWSGLSVDTNDAKSDFGAFVVGPAAPPAGAMAAGAPSIPQSGWTLLVRRLRTEKRDSKPFARTVGQYQVYVDGAPVADLRGMTVEREGPGDNGPVGKADHRCIEAGTYPLRGHNTENYTTVGFETDGDHPRPALEVGDTDARVGILIHPASGYGSTIGCINLAGSLGGPDSDFSLSDSTARVIAVIDDLKRRGNLTDEGAIRDCRLVLVDPPIDQIGRQSLRLGSRGPLVTAWQDFLVSQGFNPGAGGLDGSFGAATREATIAFQNAHGLAGDGTVGFRTITAARQLGFGTVTRAQAPGGMPGAAPKVMLILRGVAGNFHGKYGNFDTKYWPNGALDEPSALEYAKRRNYAGHVLDISGEAYANSPQTRMALQAIRTDNSIEAIYGFSGGGYNVRHVLDSLTDDEKQRIRLVVVLGAPGNAPNTYHGPWELVYRDDPNHMDGPRALLGALVESQAAVVG
jgi:peptidoglycan hydrolase-like protein with peptidoglycan-binding domain